MSESYNIVRKSYKVILIKVFLIIEILYSLQELDRLSAQIFKITNQD